MSPFNDARRVAALALLLWVPPLAAAEDPPNSPLSIERPWARATSAGAKVAAGYLTITNRGPAPDILTGFTLEAAAKAEVHDMTLEDGVMRMRPIGPVEIQPGASVTLTPSGRHIMFTGLKRGLKQGEEVAGTLTFAHAGTLPVRFRVEAVGAKSPSGDAPAAGAQRAMPGMTME